MFGHPCLKGKNSHKNTFRLNIHFCLVVPYLYCSGWSLQLWQMCVVGRMGAGAVASLLLLPPPQHSPGQLPSHSCDSASGSIPALAGCPWYPCCPWQPPWPGTASHCRPAHIPAQSARSLPPHSAGGGEEQAEREEEKNRGKNEEGEHWGNFQTILLQNI